MRRLLPALLALLAAPALAQKDVLHLYNWNQYIAQETVERFEKACACKVKQSYFADNEELVAKLSAGARGYDVMVPTANYVQGMAKAGWLQPLDKSKLPNLANLLPAYLDTEFDPGNRYSAPYAYTVTLIGYNEQKLKELGIAADSWALLFDPKVLEKLKGRVTVLDSQGELMAAALKYLGYSANDRDAKHWEEAKQTILAAKPYWAAFKATGYIEALAAGSIWVAHGYSNDVFLADVGARQNKQPFRIRHALPKEGAVLALDSMVIHKNAPRPDLAHQFVNFMLDGRNSADLTNMMGSGNPNQAAMPFIKPEIKSIAAIFPDQATARKLEQLKDLTPQQRRAMNRLWTEIKAKGR